MDGADPMSLYKHTRTEHQPKGGDVENKRDTTHKEINNSLVQAQKKKHNMEIMLDLNNMVEVPITNATSNYTNVVEHVKMSRNNIIGIDKVQMRMVDLSPRRRNTSWKRRLLDINNRECYMELPVKLNHQENDDPITTNPNGPNPLIRKMKIKRKHEENGYDHMEESKGRKISFEKGNL